MCRPPFSMLRNSIFTALFLARYFSIDLISKTWTLETDTISDPLLSFGRGENRIVYEKTRLLCSESRKRKEY